MRDVCVDFEPCSKRYSFVSTHSKIIKLDKINDAAYSNLSCGNVRLLIAYNLKLALVPYATSEWPKVLLPFFNSILCTLCFPHMQSLAAYFFI